MYLFLSKQVIEYQKSMADDFFSGFVAMQDYLEKITRMAYEQMIWLPEENIRMYESWSRACKDGRDRVKCTIDNHYEQFIRAGA